MTAQEAIQGALSRITLADQRSDKDYPEDGIGLSSSLPVEALTRVGFMVEVVDDEDADVLPRLSVRSNTAQIEIERCPFAPLALLSSDGGHEAEVAAILQQAGITAVTLADFDGVAETHGVPAVSLLFPQRLSEAFALWDALRGYAEP